jgi:hypothetical protein
MSLARAEPAVRRPAGTDRPARPERRRHRRLRAIVTSPSRRRWPFVLFSVLLVGGLLVAVVAAQALVAQNSFRLQDMQQRMYRLQQDHDDLRLRVALDSAPGRIADEARKLGLRLPPSNDVYSLPVAGPAMGRTGSRTPPFPNGSSPSPGGSP